MGRVAKQPSPIEEIDLHIVAMMLFLMPLAWILSSHVSWYWCVGLPIVVPQGRIFVRGLGDLPKFGRSGRTYLLVNELFVLACGGLMAWLSGAV